MKDIRLKIMVLEDFSCHNCRKPIMVNNHAVYEAILGGFSGKILCLKCNDHPDSLDASFPRAPSDRKKSFLDQIESHLGPVGHALNS